MWPVAFIYQDVVVGNVSVVPRADEDLNIVIIADGEKQSANKVEIRLSNNSKK